LLHLSCTRPCANYLPVSGATDDVPMENLTAGYFFKVHQEPCGCPHQPMTAARRSRGRFPLWLCTGRRCLRRLHQHAILLVLVPLRSYRYVPCLGEWYLQSKALMTVWRAWLGHCTLGVIRTDITQRERTPLVAKDDPDRRDLKLGSLGGEGLMSAYSFGGLSLCRPSRGGTG
jgi:hypothetical protein